MNKARSPEETHRLWTQHFNAGALDNLLELYEQNALFVSQPGQTVSGRDAVREVLQGFLGLEPKFQLQFQKALQSGDLALVFSRWTLTGTAPDGGELSLTGQTSDVVRQQADGSWLFVIDNPFGGAGVEPAAS